MACEFSSGLKRGVATLSLVGLLTGCGSGVRDPDYTVREYLWNKVKTLDVGFRYDFLEGREGRLLFTIEPDYAGKSRNALLADSFFLRDNDGRVLNKVDGKIATISFTHRVYSPDGRWEKEISRKLGGGLFNRLGRLIFGLDHYIVADSHGSPLLEVKESWRSVLSPFLREYRIIEPVTRKEIGLIRNRFKAKSMLGAQEYEISLKDKTPETTKNIALAIRVIDGVEDLEETIFSSSKSKSD